MVAKTGSASFPTAPSSKADQYSCIMVTDGTFVLFLVNHRGQFVFPAVRVMSGEAGHHAALRALEVQFGPVCSLEGHPLFGQQFKDGVSPEPLWSRAAVAVHVCRLPSLRDWYVCLFATFRQRRETLTLHKNFPSWKVLTLSNALTGLKPGTTEYEAVSCLTLHPPHVGDKHPSATLAQGTAPEPEARQVKNTTPPPSPPPSPPSPLGMVREPTTSGTPTRTTASPRTGFSCISVASVSPSRLLHTVGSAFSSLWLTPSPPVAPIVSPPPSPPLPPEQPPQRAPLEGSPTCIPVHALSTVMASALRRHPPRWLNTHPWQDLHLALLREHDDYSVVFCWDEPPRVLHNQGLPLSRTAHRRSVDVHILEVSATTMLQAAINKSAIRIVGAAISMVGNPPALLSSPDWATVDALKVYSADVATLVLSLADLPFSPPGLPGLTGSSTLGLDERPMSLATQKPPEADSSAREHPLTPSVIRK